MIGDSRAWRGRRWREFRSPISMLTSLWRRAAAPIRQAQAALDEPRGSGAPPPHGRLLRRATRARGRGPGVAGRGHDRGAWGPSRRRRARAAVARATCHRRRRLCDTALVYLTGRQGVCRSANKRHANAKWVAAPRRPHEATGRAQSANLGRPPTQCKHNPAPHPGQTRSAFGAHTGRAHRRRTRGHTFVGWEEAWSQMYSSPRR